MMKLVGFSLLMACLAAGCMTGDLGRKASIDAVLARLPETPTITLKVKDQPVSRVLEMVSSQSGVKVSTPDAWFADFPISVSLKDTSLAQTISMIMGDLAYRPVLKEKSGKIAEVIIHAPRPAPQAKDVPDKGIPPAPVIPPADGSVQSLLGPPVSK